MKKGFAAMIIAMVTAVFLASSAPAATVVASAKYNGHYYEVYDISYDWNKAVRYCKNKGGHLVTITSPGEQKIITSLIKQGKRKNYWLGASSDKNGEWKWVTGEPFKYTHWAGGMPDHADEDALMTYTYDNPNTGAKDIPGEWNDLVKAGVYGSEPWFGLKNFGFICEYDAPKTSPNRAEIKRIKYTNHTARVVIKALGYTNGYEVEYARFVTFRGSKILTIQSRSTVLRIPSLRDGKKYYIRVRGFRKVGDKIYYGSWSPIKVLRT